jgi:predicted membrane protein
VKQRWVPVAILAVALFAINVIARLIVRFGFDGDEAAENRVSIAMFAAIGLTLAIAAFLRAQQKRFTQWLPEIASAAIGGMLLSILVGPFISGEGPFADGAGDFFAQVWLYAGFAVVGTVLGYWVATALGRDYRSKSLKAYTQSRAAKPHRPVRR